MRRHWRLWRTRRELYRCSLDAHLAEQAFVADPCLRTALTHQRILQHMSRLTVQIWELRA